MRKSEDISISFESSNSAEKKRGGFAFIYDWLDSLVYAIFLILLIFTFIFRVVGVSGSSMNPTLSNGDWLTVSAVPGEIKQGDIVVVTQPNSLNEPLIKRVIAKGGDTISIDFIEHTVTVNGVTLYEPYIAEPTERMGDFVYPLTVPEGCLFVMGDNRNDSLDSRFKTIGFIDERYVLGVAQVRLYPLGDWKINNDEQK